MRFVDGGLNDANQVLAAVAGLVEMVCGIVVLVYLIKTVRLFERHPEEER